MDMNIKRRAILAGIGAAAGLAITRSGGWTVNDASSASFDELLATLVRSLSSTQREYTLLSGDHPARQVTLTEAVHKGPHIGTLYNRYQTDLIREIYSRMLSEQGQRWMQNTISLEGRFEGSILKIYTNDFDRISAANSQLVINGGHYMLRSQGLRDGYALGGPISYGQQRGNNQYQVKGNAFKAHGDALNQFYQALSEKEQGLAYQVSPPSELQLQIQGTNGVFPGLRLGDVSGAAKEVAHDMLTTLFSGFTAAQQRDAFDAISLNGGIESLHVALYRDFTFYEDGTRYSDLSREQRRSRIAPYVQVWRIEGPAFVVHFQGYPHVHAYMNIVKDPTKIAIGEALTQTLEPIGQAQVKKLIGSMLKERTKAPLAFYPDILVGKISPGTVSSGSIYTLDPFANEIIIAEIAYEAMSSELRDSLTLQGVKPREGQRYRVATIDYMLRREDLFGVAERVTYTREIVRDSLIEFVTDKDIGGSFG